MSRGRELLERALTQLNPWHPCMGERRFDYTLREEIREFLASEEPEKRGPLSATAIRDAIEVDANASWFGPFGQGFLVGVRFAEKHHGIGRKND